MGERTSKFIVPREAWRGLKTYHYCAACDRVVGVPKADDPVCGACRATGLPDIFAIIDGKLRSIPRYFEAMAVRSGPFGRFRASADDPAPYSVWASHKAMNIVWGLGLAGITGLYSRAQLEEWIDTVLLDLNTDTGILEDPWVLKEKGRTTEVMQYLYNVSRRSAILFRELGFPGKYDVDEKAVSDLEMARDPLKSVAEAEAFVASRTWEDAPYAAGSQVVWALRRHADILRQKELSDDGVAEWMHQWLDREQDPATGMWGGAGAQKINTVCGAFKILVAYFEDRGWPLNHADRMIDFILPMSRPTGYFTEGDSYGCPTLDAVFDLRVANQAVPNHCAEELFGTVARVSLTFVHHWNDEEHFFSKDVGGQACLHDGAGLSTSIYMAETILGADIYPNRWRPADTPPTC